jgi:hypothetical protein
VLEDLVAGRWLLFLARSAGEDTRDVWRARVRLTPDGGVLSVAEVHDLTSTPLGDEHELVASGPYAAFATRAYGQEQCVTLLALAGEGQLNRTSRLVDRAMAAITNWQKTGSISGIGRVDVIFDAPAPAVGLKLDDSELAMTLAQGGARVPIAATAITLALATRDLKEASLDIHADAVMHLPKRFSHWVADTLRAVPWIGPAPVAWVEDQALTFRDGYRRLMFSSGGAATDIVAKTELPLPVLDASQTSIDEAHWPPPPIATMWKSSERGEGEWSPPSLPWLRRPQGVSSEAPAPFVQTFVRPDQDRPYSRVLLVAMDMRQLELDMEAGVEDPEPLTGPPGPGRIPRDPAIYRRVAAAFNGAFKTEHGHYGMMVHKRVLLPPVPSSATVVVLDDGRVGFGTWGPDRKVGGIAGIADEAITSFRQNLDPLVDSGSVNPTGRNLWGFTLPGKGAQTERSGLCVTAAGHLVYAWGDDVNAHALGKAMQMAGCDYAMHLDMNPYHTGFLFTAIDDLPSRKYKSQLLSSGMSIPVDRYIQYSPKDFFYVLVHDSVPPAVVGASPWVADAGAQPPPRWLPAFWRDRIDRPQGAVELLDIEPARVTWRIRAGSKEAPLASPLRQIAGDDAQRLLLAVGLGIAWEKRPLGLATDGRLAMTVRGGPEFGLLRVTPGSPMAIERAEDFAGLQPHEDLVELPVALWDGHPVDAPPGPMAMRMAVGLSPSGRVLVARGMVDSFTPLAEQLAAAGCTRALSLDRGTLNSGLLNRTETNDAPRASYEQSVLCAVASPMRPRAFRFEAGESLSSTPHPQ